jgi:predicted Zn-dependent protease
MPAVPSLARIAATCLALLAAVPTTAQQAGPSILRDAETEAFFKDLARPLIIAAGLDPRSVQIVLVGDPSINAFAGGGQNVFIHSGTIVAATNVNMLQGIIAHELGHISGGHNVRFNEGAGPATNISLLSLLAAGAAVALGAGEAGMAILGAGTAVAQGKFLAFSREQESRTDAAGATFLSKAGISGKGSIDFFKLLQGQEFRLAIKQDNEYNRTHPLTGTRIATLENTYRGDRAWDKPSDAILEARFKRVKGKLVGYVDDPSHVFVVYPESDSSEGARYARAYAWHRTAYAEPAAREIDALLKGRPADPYFLELKGQILLEGGKPAEAIPVLRRAVAVAPDQPLIATQLGHALVSTEDPANLVEAEVLLRKAIAQDRENPFAWYNLGVIFNRRQDEPRAALAQAESANLSGDAKSAAAKARFARAGLPKGTRDWLRADDIAEVAANELQDRKKRR